jgi:hypothetical protein
VGVQILIRTLLRPNGQSEKVQGGARVSTLNYFSVATSTTVAKLSKYPAGYITDLLRHSVNESAVRNVCVESRDGVGERPTGWRRHQELEVRRLDLFVDGDVERHESLPPLDGTATNVDIPVPGT